MFYAPFIVFFSFSNTLMRWFNAALFQTQAPIYLDEKETFILHPSGAMTLNLKSPAVQAQLQKDKARLKGIACTHPQPSTKD